MSRRPMAFAAFPPDDARKRGMELLALVGLRERWSQPAY